MIAKTIIAQLGTPCLALLGAHTLVDTGDGLLFHIQGSEAVDVVQIVLDPSDTYTLTFWKKSVKKLGLLNSVPFTTMDWKVVKTIDQIYWDMLHDIIEEATGLYTRMEGPR